ncbi:ABC transporter substrate-binding protein [Cohnella caldifontis]|uniref:ABC transporter substrate-binding protein n=1 Tax=Cohnella caldifontis TaxID=3027471 RepID=UPI0023EA9E64|nr:extracellular solute-binding protein [Cohnella sp. YIM B05605]
MKKGLAIVLAMFLILSIAACSGKSNDEQSQNTQNNQAGNDTTPAPSGSGNGGDKKQVTLRIASAETAADPKKAMEEIAQEYEQQTGVKVVVETMNLDDMYLKVQSTFGTSAQYDVMFSGYLGLLTTLKEKGIVAPVDDVIEKLGGKDIFYSPTTLQPILDGKSYRIPYDLNYALGYIRTDWLQEKGLSMPTNWDEFLNVMKAFTDKKNNKYGLILPLKIGGANNWITTSVFWANDVEIFDDQMNVILDQGDNKQRAIESLNFLKELNQYMPVEAENADFPELLAAFYGGQVGFTFYSGRLADASVQSAPDLAGKFQVMGLPRKDGNGYATTYGDDGVNIINGPNVEEAKKFVEWFFKEKYLKLVAAAPNAFFPSISSVYESEEYKSLPTVKQFWNDVAVPQQKIIQEAKVNAISLAGSEPTEKQSVVESSFIIPKMFQRVLIGNEDPSKVIDATANEIRNMIK